MSQSKPTRKKAQHQSVKQTQSKEKNKVKQTQQITVANPRILKKKKKKTKSQYTEIRFSKTNGRRLKERKKPNLKSKEKNLTHKPNILSSRMVESQNQRIAESKKEITRSEKEIRDRIGLPRLDVLPESRRRCPSASSLPAPLTSRYFISVSVFLSSSQAF